MVDLDEEIGTIEEEEKAEYSIDDDKDTAPPAAAPLLRLLPMELLGKMRRGV